jgi:hypothetical protein
MGRVFAYLFRFVVILLGYAVASLAASAFLNVVMLAWFGLAPEETRDVATGSFVFTIPFVALFVAYFAFLPAVPAIVLSELLAKRDWLFHALAGAAVALVVIVFSRRSGEPGYSDIADLNLALVVIASGMCGGIGYWAIAGRGAGGWRARAEVTSPAP